MYGLAVNLIMTPSGHPWIINEIRWKAHFLFKVFHILWHLLQFNDEIGHA